MKIFKTILATYALVLLLTSACSETTSDSDPDNPNPPVEGTSTSVENLQRAMELTDNAVEAHFTGANGHGQVL